MDFDLYMYLPSPFTQAGCDTNSIFLKSLIGFNFSFSLTGWHIKVKESSLPYYLPITGEGTVGYIPFPIALSTMWNGKESCLQFDLNSPCSFPMMITIIPTALFDQYVFLFFMWLILIIALIKKNILLGKNKKLYEINAIFHH